MLLVCLISFRLFIALLIHRSAVLDRTSRFIIVKSYRSSFLSADKEPKSRERHGPIDASFINGLRSGERLRDVLCERGTFFNAGGRREGALLLPGRGRPA